MKKLLMLGASFASTEIIKKARSRGWYTIVTDNLPPEVSLAKQAADAYWMISTSETDLLEEKCREEGIGAVFAGISEFNLDRVLFLTRKLGLPCYIDPGAWEIARNKRLFKNTCIEKGVPVVQEYPVPAPDDETAWEQIQYPAVVKPVDGNANAGLSICRDRKELEEGIRKARAFSSKPELIIERYITGEETWNYYAIAEGVVQYIYSGRVFRQPGYPTFLYSFGTTAAGGIDDFLAEMNPQCTQLLGDIGCRDGMAWIQCIRDEDGNYYALEMACRMSADIIGDVLEKCLAFDTVDWMLDTAVGVRHTADRLPKPMKRPYSGAACVYYLFADHAGKIREISGLDKLDPKCFRIEMAVKPGEDVTQYRMMVKIVFYARQTDEICQMLQQLNREIDIRDMSGRDLIVHFTDYETVRQKLEGLMQNQE